MLVLGCGKGDDARFASELNFSVTGIDISKEAIAVAKADCKNIANPPKFLIKDIFELNPEENKFDVVYEYATFCSVPPPKIEKMIEIIYSVLEDGGYFISVLFPIKELNFAPPIAINYFDFVKMMKKYFQLSYFQRNINSIKPRIGNEVLLIFKKAE